MSVGGARPGAGRPRGSRNKATAAKAAEIAASGLTPLDYLLKVMRDERNAMADRMEAAKSAAPYVHPKLANIEHSGPDGGALIVEVVSYAEAAQ